MENVYETIEKRWDESAHMYDAAHGTDRNIDLWKAEISRILGADISRLVLDVGTGTGFVSLIEAELGFRTLGLDLSVGMMKQAKQHAAMRGVEIVFVHSQVEATPFLDDSFDYVTNRSLMWTLLEPVKALEEWKRILKPGGKVVSFVHVSPGGFHHNHYDDSIEQRLPLKGADAEAFVRAFKDAGLAEVEAIPLRKLPSNHGAESAESSCWYAFIGRKP